MQRHTISDSFLKESLFSDLLVSAFENHFPTPDLYKHALTNYLNNYTTNTNFNNNLGYHYFLNTYIASNLCINYVNKTYLPII